LQNVNIENKLNASESQEHTRAKLASGQGFGKDNDRNEIKIILSCRRILLLGRHNTLKLKDKNLGRYIQYGPNPFIL